MMIKRRSLLKGMVAAPAAFALGGALDATSALANPALLPKPSLLDVTYPPKDDFGLVFMDKALDRDTTWADLVTALKRTLPNSSVDTVLDSANRHGTDGSLPDNPPRADHWFWQSGDRNDDYWYPQGLTTSADHLGKGTYNGREVQLVSWYSKHEKNKGVRVSFVDMSDPSAPAYRHVLLVEPTGSTAKPDFTEVKIHAGGIMWYGDLLYVVDTNQGLRVFDMNDLLKVTTGDKDAIGWQESDGTYQAHDYAYALPQSYAYASVVHDQPAIAYSWISLDRTSSPDSIVIGEFRETADSASRLFKWDIDYQTRRLKESNGVAQPTFAAVVDIDRMQGGTCINGKFYLTRSNTDNQDGNLLTWEPGSLVEYPMNLPPYPEDVSYDPNLDWLWCHTETNDARQVFALKVSQIG